VALHLPRSTFKTIVHSRQLAKIPPVGKAFDEITDSPEDADTYETKLRDGDVIIAYVR
jgi:hypothetical protein